MDSVAKKRLVLITMHLVLPLALFFIMLATCQSASRAGVWRIRKDSSWSKLEEGLELREAELSFERRGKQGLVARRVSITALRFNPLLFSCEATFNPVKKGRTALQVVEKTGAVAGFNGGYFGMKLEPVALLISGGKRLARRNAKQPDSAAFIVTKKGKPAVVPMKNVKPPYKGMDFAVQNQPLLVHRGKAIFFPRGKDGKRLPAISRGKGHRRTVAGVDALGRAVLMVCDKPVGLVELSSLLAMSESRGGFGLSAAVNLDGGPSSGMAVVHAGSKTRRHVRAGRTIPCIILVRKRASPIAPGEDRKRDQAPACAQDPSQGRFVPVRPPKEGGRGN